MTRPGLEILLPFIDYRLINTGTPGDCWDCPVARALNAALAAIGRDDLRAHVTNVSVTFYRNSRWVRDFKGRGLPPAGAERVARVKTITAVGRWVDAFDTAKRGPIPRPKPPPLRFTVTVKLPPRGKP